MVVVCLCRVHHRIFLQFCNLDFWFFLVSLSHSKSKNGVYLTLVHNFVFSIKYNQKEGYPQGWLSLHLKWLLFFCYGALFLLTKNSLTFI